MLWTKNFVLLLICIFGGWFFQASTLPVKKTSVKEARHGSMENISDIEKNLPDKDKVGFFSCTYTLDKTHTPSIGKDSTNMAERTSDIGLHNTHTDLDSICENTKNLAPIALVSSPMQSFTEDQTSQKNTASPPCVLVNPKRKSTQKKEKYIQKKEKYICSNTDIKKSLMGPYTNPNTNLELADPTKRKIETEMEKPSKVKDLSKETVDQKLFKEWAAFLPSIIDNPSEISNSAKRTRIVEIPNEDSSQSHTVHTTEQEGPTVEKKANKDSFNCLFIGCVIGMIVSGACLFFLLVREYWI
ncbi:hypothetical protein NECID01_1095 [Nematocida sp. AWRm77]|nr:hypothetical protein NECID01_1095 [Nematocida sp. AWRm77]